MSGIAGASATTALGTAVVPGGQGVAAGALGFSGFATGVGGLTTVYQHFAGYGTLKENATSLGFAAVSYIPGMVISKLAKVAKDVGAVLKSVLGLPFSAGGTAYDLGH